MDRWAKRVALVTGASTGIGATICRELVKHGMIVFGCARKSHNILSIASECEEKKYPGKLLAINCNLENEDEILKMFAEIKENFNRLDLCINNAVANCDSSLLEGATSEWKLMLEVDLLAVCICTREAIKLMKEAGVTDGQIIHMSSMVSHKIPPVDMYAPDRGSKRKHWHHIYNSIKWGIRVLAEGLRQELKADNSKIRVATISPGPTRTGMLSKCIGAREAARFYDHFECLEPSDVSGAVLFILKTPPHGNVNDVMLEPLGFTI